jgi:hypothetical protein
MRVCVRKSVDTSIHPVADAHGEPAPGAFQAHGRWRGAPGGEAYHTAVPPPAVAILFGPRALGRPLPAVLPSVRPLADRRSEPGHRGTGACDQRSACLTLGGTTHSAALIVRERNAARGERSVARHRPVATSSMVVPAMSPSTLPNFDPARPAGLPAPPQGELVGHCEADVWSLSAHDTHTLTSIHGVATYPAR